MNYRSQSYQSMKRSSCKPRYKMLYPISFADAFAAAAAFQQHATLVTGDPEFNKLQEIIKIEMLPRNAI